MLAIRSFKNVYGFCLIDVLQPSKHNKGNVEHGQSAYTHYFRASLDRLSSLPVQRAHIFFRQLMTTAFKLLDSAVEREWQ